MNNQQAINLLKNLEQSLDDYCELNDEGKTAFGMAITALELFGNSEQLPSAQPEKRTEERAETHACDLIDREAAVDAIYHHLPSVSRTRARTMLHEVPSAQPDSKELSFTHKSLDTVSRQEAIEVIDAVFPVDPMKSEYAQGIACGAALAKTYVEQLPSVQPERTCVNCGRTVNNGGWYADGRTRCPIEEHYALPKDGYCHLWEKRNVTDDDCPERREE